MTPTNTPDGKSEEPIGGLLWNTARQIQELVGGRETKTEGEGSAEDMQEAYDHNEFVVRESEKIQAIIEAYVASITAQLATLTHDRDEWRRAAERLEQELAEAKEHKDDWMGRHHALTSEYELLSKKKEITDQLCDAREAQLTTLRSQLDETKRDSAEQERHRIENLTACLDARAERDALRLALEAIRTGLRSHYWGPYTVADFAGIADKALTDSAMQALKSRSDAPEAGP